MQRKHTIFSNEFIDSVEEYINKNPQPPRFGTWVVKYEGRTLTLGRYTKRGAWRTKGGAIQGLRSHFRPFVENLFDTVGPQPQSRYQAKWRLKDGGPQMDWYEKAEFIRSFWRAFQSLFEIVDESKS